MTTVARSWTSDVSVRADGSPWRIHFDEFTGSQPGPTTAIVAGMWGDKPMGCLAAHELASRLADADLAGSVIIAPAVNLPAIEAATRVNPDQLSFNRRFPGSDSGFLTDQLAHAVHRELTDRADCIVDLHSGTPSMALWYTYDFGDITLSAAFGYLPIVVDHTYPGQLCSVASEAGIPAILPEFGGGPIVDLKAGVEGCLNVLRHRGHLRDTPTGPDRLPVVRDLQLVRASTNGVLRGEVPASQVGKPIPPGPLGEIVSPSTGKSLEHFEVDRDGGILLMAVQTPMMIKPGDYAFMVGFPFDEIEVPSTR